jgi:hypothetical protein
MSVTEIGQKIPYTQTGVLWDLHVTFVADSRKIFRVCVSYIIKIEKAVVSGANVVCFVELEAIYLRAAVGFLFK